MNSSLLSLYELLVHNTCNLGCLYVRIGVRSRPFSYLLYCWNARVQERNFTSHLDHGNCRCVYVDGRFVAARLLSEAVGQRVGFKKVVLECKEFIYLQKTHTSQFECNVPIKRATNFNSRCSTFSSVSHNIFPSLANFSIFW